MLAYVEPERMKIRDKISTLASFPIYLASKLLPDVAFVVAASKRMPYRSYNYCCVFFPFGSVVFVLCNQRVTCREYDSHPDHIWYEVFRSVRAGVLMNGYDSC